MDEIQRIQSEQYQFPYHFLPLFDDNEIRLTRQWNWAPSYLAALQLLAEWFRRNTRKTGTWRHIDVGCGDGALLYHLQRHFAGRGNFHWTGVDYDPAAIRWADMFGAGKIDFFAMNIADMAGQRFDSASLVEVAEHIPPDDLKDFVLLIKAVMKPGAKLLVTVPHSNKGVQKKHYQHFSFDSLRAVFEPEFECLSIKGFARHSRLSKFVQRATINRKYVFTWPPLTRLVVEELSRMHSEERGVSRIFAEFRNLD